MILRVDSTAHRLTLIHRLCWSTNFILFGIKHFKCTHVPAYIKMTTDFERTFKPIFIVAKLFGFINIAYVVERNGLLIRDSSTIYYSFLEILRMVVLLVCTYIYYDNSFRFVKLFSAFKFWIVIFAARLSEIWIIK